LLKRFLCCTLVALIMLLSYAFASDARLDITLNPEEPTWHSGEDISFFGSIQSSGIDLSDCVLSLSADTDPLITDMEDSLLVFTALNDQYFDSSRVNETIILSPGETQEAITFEGTWMGPEDISVNHVTITITVISSSQELLASSSTDIWDEDALAAKEKTEKARAQEQTRIAYTVLILSIILGAIVTIWAFFRRKQRAVASDSLPMGNNLPLDCIIVLLFFFGVFLTPNHLRSAFLSHYFPNMRKLSYLNFPCTMALLLTIFHLKKWEKTDLVFFAVWLFLYLPFSVSNSISYRQWNLGLNLTIICQSYLPVFFLFYRMNDSSKEKCLKLFFVLFDSFIVVLLGIGIIEQFADKVLLNTILKQLSSRNIEITEYIRYSADSRFGFIWGHPLTNALLFNFFFLLNFAYFRHLQKRYPIWVFYPIALAGVLLTSSKTGIVVCLLLLVVSCWKQKKWFLLSVPVLGTLYIFGAFNKIIYRFTHTSLTTGRFEALTRFFTSSASQEYPIRFFSGYGSQAIFASVYSLYEYKGGFEFPLLMFALDYGVLFSVLFVLGTYGYVTWTILKKRQWSVWLCYSLVFAEINTYNGYALRNQDILIFCCFFTMVLLNMLPKQCKNPA